MGKFYLVCFINYKVDWIMNIPLFLFFACIQPQGRKFMFPDLTEHRTCDQKVVDVVGEFCSPGSAFCADSYFGVCSTPVLPILFT